MSFFKNLKELSDLFGGGFSVGTPTFTPKSTTIFKERKPDPIKVVKALTDGDVKEAVCEATGINAIKATQRDFENLRYKKTEKTVRLDYCNSIGEGALVFCELGKEAEHSGIYIGNGGIVELNGDGWVQRVTPISFYSSSQYRTGNEIYTFTDLNGNIISSKEIANRAKNKVGTKINYNVAVNNCHKFSAGCITGNFDNFNVTFTQLKELIERRYGYYEIRKVKFY